MGAPCKASVQNHVCIILLFCCRVTSKPFPLLHCAERKHAAGVVCWNLWKKNPKFTSPWSRLFSGNHSLWHTCDYLNYPKCISLIHLDPYTTSNINTRPAGWHHLTAALVLCISCPSSLCFLRFAPPAESLLLPLTLRRPSGALRLQSLQTHAFSYTTHTHTHTLTLILVFSV